MDIKVLGAGCAKCNTLAEAVKKVVEDKGIDATMSKVDDIVEIMKYGVMRTPALVINEKVVVSGTVPSASEIEKLLEA